jgi:acyl-CoA thioesterase-1
MGDSLSAAYKIAIEQSWPALLQGKLGNSGFEDKIVNASISGETTVGGLERLPALLQQHRPRIMVLELGGNDGLRGYPFATTSANLARMIELAQQSGATVLLLGVRMPPNLGPVYNQRFQAMYRDLAERYQVAFIARFLEGVAGSDPRLMQSDGIHPTALAQPILAKRVYERLRPMLEALAG